MHKKAIWSIWHLNHLPTLTERDQEAALFSHLVRTISTWHHGQIPLWEVHNHQAQSTLWTKSKVFPLRATKWSSWALARLSDNLDIVGQAFSLYWKKCWLRSIQSNNSIWSTKRVDDKKKKGQETLLRTWEMSQPIRALGLGKPRHRHRHSLFHPGEGSKVQGRTCSPRVTHAPGSPPHEEMWSLLS